ncbi:hypothetical protein EYF80_067348 [Liparis tanakae]|uniref:Uncharacterized protein n=1 Tax=Liparis tanakae TaxID=230148 RepID=A0A4Z2E1F5_9TELE|nr:hypothetical protein EYF80_067348 [Liparis tanakae]
MTAVWRGAGRRHPVNGFEGKANGRAEQRADMPGCLPAVVLKSEFLFCGDGRPPWLLLDLTSLLSVRVILPMIDRSIAAWYWEIA